MSKEREMRLLVNEGLAGEEFRRQRQNPFGSHIDYQATPEWVLYDLSLHEAKQSIGDRFRCC